MARLQYTHCQAEPLVPQPHPNLTRRYADELKLFRTRGAKAWLAALIALWVFVPMVIVDPFWLSVLNYAGIAAIGAIGLNLLTGYTGQVSLGHAFFIGAGAYAAAAIGGDLGLPLVLWLPAAAIVGGCHRRADRPVRAAPARQLPGDRDARPRLPRRAPVPQPRARSPAATPARR